MSTQDELMARQRWWRWLLAFLIAAGGIMFQSLGAVPSRPIGHAAAELAIADDLAVTGRLTDGIFSGIGDPAQRPAGMRVSPLYPAVLATVIWFDPDLADRAACISAHPGDGKELCPDGLGHLVRVQSLLAIVTLILLWRTVLVATSSRSAALVALLFAAYVCPTFAANAHQVTDAVIAAPLMVLLMLSLIEAMRRHSLVWSVTGGLALGLLMMDDWSYLGLALLLGISGGGVMVWTASRPSVLRWIGEIWLVTALFGIIACAPWIGRNLVMFSTPAITQHYDGRGLVERVLYDDISIEEWAAGWVYSVPYLGPSKAERWFQPADYARYRTGHLSGDGGDGLFERSLAFRGLWFQPFYLVRFEILPHLGAYLATTALLIWRSLWSVGGIGLISFPCLVWMVWRATRRGHLRIMMLAGPPLAPIVIQALVSTAPASATVGLLPVLACAVGAALITSLATGRAVLRRLMPSLGLPSEIRLWLVTIRHAVASFDAVALVALLKGRIDGMR